MAPDRAGFTIGERLDLNDRQSDGAEAYVTARLNARLRPLDRGEIYEDALDGLLKDRSLGEVTGGGTMQGESGEIQFCDLEIRLTQVTEESLDQLRRWLEDLGAPKGSALLLDRETDNEVAFGRNEGLAVYFNGTDLPDEVYAECDINLVFQEFEKLLGANGRIQSYWEGPQETAFYLYGPSYGTMLAAIQPFLDSYPLCQKARLVQVA